MITKEQVLKALSEVQEPDLGKDLVTLNMVRDIIIENKNVRFTIVLTTPACPMKEHIKNACTNAVLLLVDKEARVTVNFSAQVKQNTNTENPLPNVKNIIAVFSGKGGVGKSTIAANLAVTLSRKKDGLKIGLVDADIYGPSIPIMFGIKGTQPMMTQINGKNKLVPIKKYDISLISIGLLIDDKQAVVWRGPMASNAIRQFITDVHWGDLDYLIIDMPPGTSDIHLTLLNLLNISGAIIVSTPQKVALADAKKAIVMFPQAQSKTPIIGIVENMAYFTPQELPDHKYYIFGKNGAKALAEEFEVPFLGEVPLVQSIRENSDNGIPEALHEDSPLSPVFHTLADKAVRSLSMYQAGMDRVAITNTIEHFNNV